MSTGPEHYQEAERLRAEAMRLLANMTPNTADESQRGASVLLAAAQVDATLALAAATALQTAGVAQDGPTARDWRKTIVVEVQD